MSTTSEARITSASVLAFTIPTDQPESDGTAKWDATTVVFVELSAGGRTGLGYAYANIAAVPAFGAGWTGGAPFTALIGISCMKLKGR